MEKESWEKMPQKLEWHEEVEFYPVFINRKIFRKIRRVNKDALADYCIKTIRENIDYSIFSIDREMLMEQIENLNLVMGDKFSCYNTCLLLVPLNHISEVKR